VREEHKLWAHEIIIKESVVFFNFLSGVSESFAISSFYWTF